MYTIYKKSSVADPDPYPDPYWIRIRWATNSGSVFGLISL